MSNKAYTSPATLSFGTNTMADNLQIISNCTKEVLITMIPNHCFLTDRDNVTVIVKNLRSMTTFPSNTSAFQHFKIAHRVAIAARIAEEKGSSSVEIKLLVNNQLASFRSNYLWKTSLKVYSENSVTIMSLGFLYYTSMLYIWERRYYGIH